MPLPGRISEILRYLPPKSGPTLLPLPTQQLMHHAIEDRPEMKITGTLMSCWSRVVSPLPVTQFVNNFLNVPGPGIINEEYLASTRTRAPNPKITTAFEARRKTKSRKPFRDDCLITIMIRGSSLKILNLFIKLISLNKNGGHWCPGASDNIKITTGTPMEAGILMIFCEHCNGIINKSCLTEFTNRIPKRNRNYDSLPDGGGPWRRKVESGPGVRRPGNPCLNLGAGARRRICNTYKPNRSGDKARVTRRRAPVDRARDVCFETTHTSTNGHVTWAGWVTVGELCQTTGNVVLQPGKPP